MDTDVNYDGRGAQRTLVSNRTPKLILLAAGTWFFALGAYSLYIGKPAYSALMFSAAALLLAASRLEPKWRSRAAFCVLSSLLGVYSAELLLATLLPLQGGLRAWLDNRAYDYRTYHRVVRDFRSDGVAAYPFVSPGALLDNPPMADLTPLGAISNTTTVYCNEGGNYLTYQSDEHGFHNPPGIWYHPADVVVAGDSFTQGACVSSGENFAGGIRDRFPRTVNLGQGGNGPLMMLAGLREYLPALRPKVVFWCFYEGNDLADLKREKTHPVLQQYLSNDQFRQGLVDSQPEIDRVLKEYTDRTYALDRASLPLVDSVIHRVNLRGTLLQAIQFNHLLGMVNRLFDQPFGYGTASDSDQIPLLGEVLRKARGTVEAHGGRLVFVLLPGWDLAVQRSERRARNKVRVIETAGQAGLSVIDLTVALRNLGDPAAAFWYPSSHYKPLGYSLVARELLNELESHPPSTARE